MSMGYKSKPGDKARLVQMNVSPRAAPFIWSGRTTPTGWRLPHACEVNRDKDGLRVTDQLLSLQEEFLHNS